MSAFTLTFNSALTSSLQTTAAVLFLSGIGAHLIIRPYEIDTKGWTLFFSYHAILATLWFGYVFTGGFSCQYALLRTIIVSSLFNLGLVGSILTYRAFFHRLHHFPGPFWAKLTRFYAMKHAAKNLEAHRDIEKLHEKYGDFVRVGPREISINREEAIKILYETSTQCVRSPWYSQVSDDLTKISLHSTRDLTVHKNRKRAWMRGLSSRALDTYRERIVSKVDLLISRIDERESLPTDMTQYAIFFGFDVMGDVGFSKDFNMLSSGHKNPAIQSLHECMAAVGILGTVPWLMSMLGKVPGATGSYARFIDWCGQELEAKRVMADSEKSTLEDQEPRDVISWLLKAEDENDRSAPPGEGAFHEDSRLMIVAGSDTVSVALTNALYYLTKNKAAYQKLQTELQAEFPGGEQEWTHQRVKAIPWLDYIVQETLRLKPSVPAGLTRLTPATGIQVDEVFIPGDTIVSVPAHTIHRDSRYWDDALEFRPERWENLNSEKVPWIPFTRGQFACAGKNLALMELRMVLSRIALRYDMSSPPGEDMEKFDREAKDTFTLNVPPLRIIFTRRGPSIVA